MQEIKLFQHVIDEYKYFNTNARKNVTHNNLRSLY